MRKIMRKGQPRNMRQPTMTQKPSTKRVSGAEPPRACHSPFPMAMRKLPSTRPTISGLMYCTASAR